MGEWKLVPVEPTGDMMDAVRHLFQWLAFARPTEQELLRHCERRRIEPPAECRDVDHVPPKRMMAYWVYKGMLAASPAPSLPEDAERVVERFEITHDPDIGMIHRPHPHGYYVRYSDYSDLQRQLAEVKENYLIAHSRASERDQECLRLEDEITKQKDRLFRQIDFTGELQRLLWALSQGNDIPETIKDSHAYKVASIVKADRDRLAAENERKLAAAKEALNKIHNCGQSAEPDHWKFRQMARERARAALASLEDRT